MHGMPLGECTDFTWYQYYQVTTGNPVVSHDNKLTLQFKNYVISCIQIMTEHTFKKSQHEIPWHLFLFIISLAVLNLPDNSLTLKKIPGFSLTRGKPGRPWSWWRHQMETFSASLAICAENSPVPGEFPAQRPVTRGFDVFFDLRLNKRLNKQCEAGDLKRHRAHYDVTVMLDSGLPRRPRTSHNLNQWQLMTQYMRHQASMIQ